MMDVINEEWCFRPNVLKESISSYEDSGDITFDEDAGHFNDFCNSHSVTGQYNNRQFSAVIIPEGTKSIPAKAFAFCSNLRYVYIPDSVKRIEGGAFAHCFNLLEVSLPKRITIEERKHEWWHEYEWGPYDDVDHDDDYYYETFEDWSCLNYREQPLSADEWLATIKEKMGHQHNHED